MKSPYSIPRFLAVDFYCGAGGTTRGIIDADGFVICGIDKDESNRLTYQKNNKNTTLTKSEPEFLAFDMFPECQDYPQGQQHLVWSALQDLIPRHRAMAGPIPLLFVICAPCQSFTRFVQRRLTDSRAQSRGRDLDLLSQTIAFIATFKPEMVISENVARITTGPYSHIWSDFQQELRALGYTVDEDRVCAARFGIPQYRRRSVLLALRTDDGTGSSFDLQVPTCDPEAPQVSVREAIGHYPSLQAGEHCEGISNHICSNLTDINHKRLLSLKPGETNVGFSTTPFGDLSLACHQRLANRGKQGFSDIYTRMSPHRPAPTLTTRFHSVSNGRYGHYDQKQVRGLSLREGATLQSFPEDYEFPTVGIDATARMIGNAVPPKLSRFMTTWLFNQWQQLQHTSKARSRTEICG